MDLLVTEIINIWEKALVFTFIDLSWIKIRYRLVQLLMLHSALDSIEVWFIKQIITSYII